MLLHTRDGKMWEYLTNSASSAESSATGRVLHKHCCTFFSWKSVTLCSVPRVLSNASGSYVARSACVRVCPPLLHVNADKTGRLVFQLGSVFSKNSHPVELAAANIVIGKQGLSPFLFCYLETEIRVASAPETFFTHKAYKSSLPSTYHGR